MKKLIINGISKVKPTPQQALDGLKMLYDVYKENHKVSEIENTKRSNIQALKEVEIEKIKSQKEILKEYFENVFEERKNNFENLFDLLDKGIDSNNSSLIEQSLNAIITIAKDSPLNQINKLKSDFNNPNIKEIEI